MRLPAPLAAGTVTAVAVAVLPFAGGVGHRSEHLATTAGRAVTVDAPVAPAPDTTPVAVTVPGGRTSAAAPSPAPADAPPPLPPPPAGAPLDPEVGVVPGDGSDADLADPDLAAPAVPVAAVPPPAPPPAGLPAATPGERVWAVVVGIDDYPGRQSDLHAATADAGDLVAGLLRLGVPAHHVRTVYDGDATIAGVLAAVDWLVANAGPDDTAVFFYAGHVRELGGGTEAIVTAEAGWITDWFLADRFRGLAARDAWFVMAACYGGGFDELLGPGRVLTAGAGPGELAYESEAYGRSYLAEFVLRRGILGGEAGEPTVQAAVAWATAQLAERHPDRQVWHRDEAGHLVSLDGVRRDGSTQPPPGRSGDGRPGPRPLLPLAPGPPDRPCILGLLAC